MRAVAGLVLALLAVLLPAGQAPSAADEPAPSRHLTLDLRDAYLDASPDGGTRSARGRTSARPSDPADGSGEFFWDPAAPRGQLCGAAACVHYVTTTSDAPPLASSDGVTPDWVRRSLDVTELALARMAELGYPGVPSDAARGGSPHFDVYLADISRAGLYGYCAPEAPVLGASGRASSYCVFDDDFTGFPKSADDSLRVTAAHELFHAVQFGMDVHEDRWFLESTATWMEEQVADDVDDNRQYLSAGQLGRRHVPLDHSAADLGLYGNWIFFQFLAQRYGVDAVRQVWELAATGPGRRDDFSVKAVRRFVESRGDSFSSIYASFVHANLTPRRGYDEGRAYRRPAVDDSVRLGPTRRSWREERIAVPHLTGHAIALRPQTGLRGRARLRLSVTTTRSSGAAATVRVFLESGKVATLAIRLRRGHGDRVVRFSDSRVRRVVVVLANASTRYDCRQRTHFACQGKPLDEAQRFGLTASLLRAHR